MTLYQVYIHHLPHKKKNIQKFKISSLILGQKFSERVHLSLAPFCSGHYQTGAVGSVVARMTKHLELSALGKRHSRNVI